MYGDSHQRPGTLDHGAGELFELGHLLAGDFEGRIGENHQADAPVLAENRGFGLARSGGRPRRTGESRG